MFDTGNNLHVICVRLCPMNHYTPLLVDRFGLPGIALMCSDETMIPNQRRMPRAPEAMAAAAAIHTGRFPDIKVRSMDNRYSCVSLVFAARRTWVDVTHLDMILTADGYDVVSESDAMVGDLIVYSEVGEKKHVGVVVDITLRVCCDGVIDRDITVRSQWGQDGEYLHLAQHVDVDQFGSQVEFYTERVR